MRGRHGPEQPVHWHQGTLCAPSPGLGAFPTGKGTEKGPFAEGPVPRCATHVRLCHVPVPSQIWMWRLRRSGARQAGLWVAGCGHQGDARMLQGEQAQSHSGTPPVTRRSLSAQRHRTHSPAQPCRARWLGGDGAEAGGGDSTAYGRAPGLCPPPSTVWLWGNYSIIPSLRFVVGQAEGRRQEN